ncbi:hypothetical protein [Microvirga splendida]|uniref:J domain-containing protein n=1 Tax=Microvirga splendida TaxID=2795727 RepID=A0ABS0XZA8_9HYPH|nr:hypothetical protein [Microvirga splendida]MBJ6125396.1 hypothetical protein [Microvirga splendida]
MDRAVLVTSATDKFDIVDLTSDRRTSAYFDMRTLLDRYRRTPDKESQRILIPDLSDALARFLALSRKDREELHLAFSFGLSDDELREMRGGSAATPLPMACEFFSEDDFKDEIALKNAYRRNVNRHHPDKGGSHDAMVRLNRRYAELKGFRFNDPPARSLYRNSMRTAKKYYHNMPWLGSSPDSSFEADMDLVLDLYELLVDDFELEAAYRHLHGGVMPMFESLERSYRNKRKTGALEHRRVDLFETTYKFLRYCKAVSLDEWAAELDALASAQLPLVRRPGMTRSDWDRYWAKYGGLMEGIRGGERPRLNPPDARRREKLAHLRGNLPRQR